MKKQVCVNSSSGLKWFVSGFGDVLQDYRQTGTD